MNKPIHPAVAEHVMEENEKLRGLLAEVAHCLRTTDEQPLYWEENLASRIYRALSQQAEPAPAQDEREESAEALFEHYLQNAIDNAPEPLRRLGEHLSHVLDEDRWATAERLLNGAIVALTRPAQTEQQPIHVTAVAVTREDPDEGLYLDWLLEGGICELEHPGQVLVLADRPITDDEGHGEVFAAPIAQTALTPWQEATGRAAFKNFHRSLCERFGYMHDEEFWWRDLISLEEHIAKQTAPQPEQSGLTDDGKEAAMQKAFELGGLEDGSYHLESDELELVIRSALSTNGDKP